MKFQSSVTAVSWIPFEAVKGFLAMPFGMGLAHYDEPLPARLDDLDEWQAVALGQKPGHIYSRNTNPTVSVFEEKIRLLEGAEAATSFASGMAAISNTAEPMDQGSNGCTP